GFSGSSPSAFLYKRGLISLIEARTQNENQKIKWKNIENAVLLLEIHIDQSLRKTKYNNLFLRIYAYNEVFVQWEHHFRAIHIDRSDELLRHLLHLCNLPKLTFFLFNCHVTY